MTVAGPQLGCSDSEGGQREAGVGAKAVKGERASSSAAGGNQ